MPVSSVDRPVSALRQRMLEHGDARSAITYAARLYSVCAQLRSVPRAVPDTAHEASGADRVGDHDLSGLSVPGSSSPSATKRSMSAVETETDIA
jgi:hypothetical protein